MHQVLWGFGLVLLVWFFLSTPVGMLMTPAQIY